MCAQRRLRSAWESAQYYQSLCYLHEEALCPQLPIERTAKTLIRLGGCPGWSESSLCAHVILLVLLRCGSFNKNKEQELHKQIKITQIQLFILTCFLKTFEYNSNILKFISQRGETSMSGHDVMLLVTLPSLFKTLFISPLNNPNIPPEIYFQNYFHLK